MKSASLLVFVLAFGAGASYGAAPSVDPHHPVVDGKPMTQAEYLKKYCAGPESAKDSTCVAVSKALNADATKGKLPKGW